MNENKNAGWRIQKKWGFTNKDQVKFVVLKILSPTIHSFISP